MAEYETVLQKEVEFIPEWDHNAEKDAPIKVFLRYLTTGERARCFNIDTDPRGNVHVTADDELLFRLGVVRIENFTVNGKAITTAREVLELLVPVNAPPFGLLVDEVGSKVSLMNWKADSKN